MANFLFPFIFGTFILFFLNFLANFIIFKNLQINKKLHTKVNRTTGLSIQYLLPLNLLPLLFVVLKPIFCSPG